MLCQERDSETGLDYFIARHYASNLGRFLQPDEFTGGPVDAFSSNDPLQPGPLPYANITDPRSLNKYSYTYNNPLRYTDPSGHCPPCAAAAAPAVLGFVIGGTIELGKQLESRNFNSAKVVGKGIKAGLVGGAAALTAKMSIGEQTVAVTGANVLGGLIERAIDADPTTNAIDLDASSEDVLDGLAAGLAGGLAGKVAGVVADSAVAATVVSIGRKPIIEKVVKAIVTTIGKLGAADAKKDSDAEQGNEDP